MNIATNKLSALLKIGLALGLVLSFVAGIGYRQNRIGQKFSFPQVQAAAACRVVEIDEGQSIPSNWVPANTCITECEPGDQTACGFTSHDTNGNIVTQCATNERRTCGSDNRFGPCQVSSSCTTGNICNTSSVAGCVNQPAGSQCVLSGSAGIGNCAFTTTGRCGCTDVSTGDNCTPANSCVGGRWCSSQGKITSTNCTSGSCSLDSQCGTDQRCTNGSCVPTSVGGSCASGWFCNGNCANSATVTLFNNTWVDGKARWLWEAAGNNSSCGGSESSLKSGTGGTNMCSNSDSLDKPVVKYLKFTCPNGCQQTTEGGVTAWRCYENREESTSPLSLNGACGQVDQLSGSSDSTFCGISEYTCDQPQCQGTPPSSPTPPATTPPVGPMCLSITMTNVTRPSAGTDDPTLNETVRFTCGTVSGVSKYVFRIVEPDNNIVDLQATGATSEPYTISKIGSYRAQCQICTSSTSCTPFEQLN